MKITFLGPAYPYRGGMAAFNERLAREFLSEGKDVSIQTFTVQYPRCLSKGKKQYSESPPPEGLRITRSVSTINPLNWISAGLRIKRMQPDILLLRYWTPFFALCLGTIARIARSNNYTVVISVVDKVLTQKESMITRILTRYFVKSINGAVVMSESVSYDLKNYRKEFPVVYCPHPLFDVYGRSIPGEEAIKALNLDPSFSYLLFFGCIREIKGLDILLKALADNRIAKLPVKLIVAGEFRESEEPYRKLIDELNLTNRVILTNKYIRDEEVKLYFSAADLVVQPYKSFSKTSVIQTAFQFNKPVVVTGIEELKDIVKNNITGYVTDPDPKSVADAIYDFYLNNRKSEFTKAIIKEKGRFGWNKMTAAVIEVFYKSLLAQLIKAM
ncbi:MAG: glycosyltransferase [Bacteroidales bacterium]|nr:glycosyltransferase [Bacteroidales bacterium]